MKISDLSHSQQIAGVRGRLFAMLLRLEERLHFGCFPVLGRGNVLTRADSLFDLFAAQVFDHRHDGEVAHFDRVLPAMAERPPAPPPSLEALAPHLRAHLYTTEMLPKDTQHVIRKHLAEDLWIVLVADLGNALMGLSPEAVEHLQRPHEELLRIAVENMERERVERDPIPLTGGMQGFGLFTKEPTAASQILYLGNHLGRHHPAGALVSFPTRYTCTCLPLQTGAGPLLLEAIRAFLFATHKVHLHAKERPDGKPFSPAFYWWRDGALRLFPTNITPTDIFLMPPQDFVDEVLGGPGPGMQ